MLLENLNSAQLARMIPLLKEKEMLLAKIKLIDEKIAVIQKSGDKPEALVKIPPRFNRQGALREAILDEIKKAGKRGIQIKEIAENLGMERQRIDTWIYQNGKKYRLKKIKEGRTSKYMCRA